ncbi:hypothetical protein FE236_08885 [Mariprofundus erugo]|uniref:Uncharacterized protein n=1 Tax=Mariprofundus erugo TaxID=2528639 RepID=A0A5R9GKR8_9PROT|nr:hypothetical protein [Mariprofundus erugo]TLS65629.1 hypothetical protein FEF65_12430 [Mariprofundus erugo]TLS75696.1 hypothetical protein FE236_08885 [Mariprofundus erugo]
MKKVYICFAAGCLGALANSLVIWSAGDFGLTHRLGVSIAPALTPAWLYPRLVWGGLWGLLFMLPFMDTRTLLKGSLLSLLPTAAQLFYFFPVKLHKGMGGIDLGLLTPAVVLFANWIWGVVTAYAIRYAR